MHPIAYLFDMVLSLCSFFIMSWVILRWLINLHIVNRYNQIVDGIFSILERIVTPILSYVRRYIPNIFGIDLSPLLLLILIHFLRYTLHYYFVFHR